MRIQAAVLRGTEPVLTIEDVDLSPPAADEILVRLVATGVCHTDIKAARQGLPVPRPIVLGHEGAGIVEAVGSSVRKLRAGDPVVMTIDSCGLCPSCTRDKPAYCYEVGPRNFSGTRPDGSSPLSREGEFIHANFFGQSSFATYAIAHERNAVKVREDILLDLLGPLGCGIQTGAGAVFNSLKVQAGESIAVFGTGAVGLSSIMAARVAGAGRIIAIDISQARLDLAHELGATDIINGAQVDAQQAIMDLTAHGVDYALDTTASSKVIRQAFGSLAPLGVCGVMASAHPTQEVLFPVLDLMRGGRTVRGIIEGDTVPDLLIPQLVELHAQGLFPFERLVTFYPFERINDALRDGEAGAVIKPIVRFDKS